MKKIQIAVALAAIGAAGVFGEGQDMVRTLKLGGANGYVVYGSRGNILVDAGMDKDAKRLAAALAEIGERPEDIVLIVVTHAHPDHVGALAAARALTGAKVLCTAEAADFLRTGTSSPIVPRTRMGRFIDAISPDWKVPAVEPDVTFSEELDLSSFGVAGKVVRTPGHTAESLCLFLDSGEAFVGDLVRGSGAKLTFGMFYEDAAVCAQSVERVLAERPSVIHLSHGATTDGPDLAAFLRGANAPK
jgi:glyoxylase-like metal-dependent hydrolase (beta-lactamase superfamily II)